MATFDKLLGTLLLHKHKSSDIIGGTSDPTKVLKTGDTMTGALLINGSSDEVQLGVQANGTQTADLIEIKDSGGGIITRIDHNGYFSTNAPNRTNIFTIKSGGTTTATGTTTANNTLNITGVGTKFTSELGVGDQISLSSNPGTYATVGSITDDTHLVLATNSPSLGDGSTQTINIVKALFSMQDSGGTTRLLVQDNGFMGIGGQLYLDVAFSIAGNMKLNGNSFFFDTDNTYGAGRFNSGIAGVQMYSFGGFRFQTSDGGTQTRLWIDKNYTGIATETPASRLEVNGSIATAINSYTSTHTLGDSDSTSLDDATGAGYTVTLPSASNTKGRIYTIKKIDSSGNAVVVGTTSTQTIDGSTTYSLASQNKYVSVQSDGSNWQIIANN